MKTSLIWPNIIDISLLLISSTHIFITVIVVSSAIALLVMKISDILNPITTPRSKNLPEPPKPQHINVVVARKSDGRSFVAYNGAVGSTLSIKEMCVASAIVQPCLLSSGATVMGVTMKPVEGDDSLYLRASKREVRILQYNNVTITVLGLPVDGTWVNHRGALKVKIPGGAISQA